MKLKIYTHIDSEYKLFDKNHWLFHEINQNFGTKITRATKIYYFNYMLIFER